VAYCTEDDVTAKLPGGNMEPYLRGTEVDLRAQIAVAEDEINPELKALGYRVPFADGDVPDGVRALCAWKAIELLCFRVPGLSQWYEAAERQVDKKLKMLRQREAELVEDDAKGTQYERQSAVVSGLQERRFTQDRLDRM